MLEWVAEQMTKLNERLGGKRRQEVAAALAEARERLRRRDSMGAARVLVYEIYRVWNEDPDLRYAEWVLKLMRDVDGVCVDIVNKLNSGVIEPEDIE